MSPGQKLLLPMIVALLLLTHACSRSQPSPASGMTATLPTAMPTPTPTPTPINPQALLEMSGEIMANLDSFHFRLEHEDGGTPLAQNMVLEEAEGDVARPDRLSLAFSGTAGNFALKGSLITVGDTSYMTNPLTGDLEPIPAGVSPLSFFNPTEGISAMMSQVEGASLLSSDGERYRVGGAIPAVALEPLFGDTVDASSVSVEITLDAGELYLIEVVLDGRITPTEPDGVVRVIELSRFNEPVNIQPPE